LATTPQEEAKVESKIIIIIIIIININQIFLSLRHHEL